MQIYEEKQQREANKPIYYNNVFSNLLALDILEQKQQFSRKDVKDLKDSFEIVTEAQKKRNSSASQILENVKKIATLTLFISTGFLAVKGIMGALNTTDYGAYTPEGTYVGSGGRYAETSEANKIKNKIINEAERQGVDPALALALAQKESGFRQYDKKGQLLKPPKYRNDPDSPVGVFQIKPSTAKGMGYNDVTNIDQNIAAGVAYLRNQLKAFGGDRNKALAAYNAGPNAVRKYGGIPPYKETQNYVKTINANYDKFKNELSKLAPINAGTPSENYNKYGGTWNASNTKVGNYNIGSNVTMSGQVNDYLKELSDMGGSGYISSVVRSGNKNKLESHASGNKLDFGLGSTGGDQEKIIQICVPIMRHPATVHIAFECLGKYKNNADSKRIADEIVAKIRSRYPDIDNRIKSGGIKVITDWGWKYGTGPHLDVLINGAKLKKASNVNNNYNQSNKNDDKATKGNNVPSNKPKSQPQNKPKQSTPNKKVVAPQNNKQSNKKKDIQQLTPKNKLK